MTKHERTLDLICRLVEAHGHDGAWPRIHGMSILMICGSGDQVTRLTRTVMRETWDIDLMVKYLDRKMESTIDCEIVYRKKKETVEQFEADSEGLEFAESMQAVAKAEQEQKPCTSEQNLQRKIEGWLERATHAMELDHQRQWSSKSTVEFRKLRKYYKIIQNGSVYAFIDFDGYIYKAAGANAPAKGARGHIDKVNPETVSSSTRWLYAR